MLQALLELAPLESTNFYKSGGMESHSRATVVLRPAAGCPVSVELDVVNDPGKPRGKKQCNLWEFVWGASVCLGELVLSPRFSTDEAATAASSSLPPLPPLRGLRVLEIGAGTGLSSIAAARAGAREVVATDLVLDALALIERNAVLNGVGSIVRTEKLDWYNSGAFVAANAGAFDLIVASDVLFMGSAAKPLARLLGALMRPGALAVVVDPGRHNVDEFIVALGDLDSARERSGELRPELLQLHGVAYDVCVLKQLNVVTVECFAAPSADPMADGSAAAVTPTRAQWDPVRALASARARVIEGGALTDEHKRLVSAVTTLSRDVDAEDRRRVERAARTKATSASAAKEKQ